MRSHESRADGSGRSHVPFMAALATLASGRHPLWQPTLAGLITMRAVDRWAGQGGPGTRCAVALDGARRAIGAIGAGAAVRVPLHLVVEALATTSPSVPRAVLEPLLDYGRALEFDAAWPLSLDVYETVIGHAEGRRAEPLAGQAALRLGYAHRMLAQHGEAEQWYVHAHLLARESGDAPTRLLSHVGLAKVAMARGNYARAREMLMETVAYAEALGVPIARSSALHELSDLAYRNGQYDTALRLLHDALPGYWRPFDRHRALNDMAVNFAELGLLDAARDAYLVVLVGAEEQTMRWTALTNLLELAGRRRDRAAVEAYRRQLAAAALPPVLEFTFWSQLGHAYAHLADARGAEPAFATALRVAEAYGLHGRAFETERELAVLAQRVLVARNATPPIQPMPPAVSEIAGAIREMRESVCEVA